MSIDERANGFGRPIFHGEPGASGCDDEVDWVLAITPFQDLWLDAGLAVWNNAFMLDSPMPIALLGEDIGK